MSIKNIKIANNYLPYKELDLNFIDGNGVLIRELLIFGRNGTGKSTIAKAIADNEKNKSDNSTEVNIEFNSSDITQPNYFIFDENFMRDKIRFSENDNLEAIVMFDEQKGFVDDIELCQNNLDRNIIINQKYGGLIESYNPGKALNNVLQVLKGENNWAERANRINSKSKQNKRVDKAVLDRILKYENNEKLEDLFNELNEKRALILTFSNEEKIDNINSFENLNIELIKEIECTLKEKPAIEFSGNLDSDLDIIFEEYGNQYLKDLNKYFETEPNICKTCFRPLDKEYIENLRSKLKKAFENEVIETQIKKIEDIIVKLPKEYNPIEINNIKTKELNYSIKELNNELNQIVKILKEKAMNINKEYSYNLSKYDEITEKINKLVSDKNKEINNYNKKIDELHLHIEEYESINNKIAFIEIKKEYENYQEKKLKNEMNNKLYLKSNKLVEERKKVIATLKIQQKQTQIALKNRLVLEGMEGHYKILTRSKNIPLSKLSTGEKNVLALVYFFSLINKEKKTNQFFKENNFIMLDDPISSFDFENKIGIYNYIRKQFKDVYSKNKYSQILITTHDMEVYYNLEKVFQDIILDNGKKLTNRVNKYVLTEIGLESDKKDKLNNIYSNQVKFIYEFANGNKDEAENYIGNTMRRVCEAFSTFKYRCGIDNLRTDKIVIETIDSEELKIFFENYLFRLILNNESHESDRSKGITDQNIIDYLTLNEKKKTAKLVILFLYKLDNIHIIKQLVSKNNEIEQVKNIIDDWEKEITNLLI